jgi:hypothetical protein
MKNLKVRSKIELTGRIPLRSPRSAVDCNAVHEEEEKEEEEEGRGQTKYAEL